MIRERAKLATQQGLGINQRTLRLFGELSPCTQTFHSFHMKVLVYKYTLCALLHYIFRRYKTANTVCTGVYG